MARPYCAFFDVDHTLMRGSTRTALGKQLWRAKVIGFGELARALSWNVMYLAGRTAHMHAPGGRGYAQRLRFPTCSARTAPSTPPATPRAAREMLSLFVAW